MENKKFAILSIGIGSVIMILIVLIFLSAQRQDNSVANQETFSNGFDSVNSDPEPSVETNQSNARVSTKLVANPTVVTDPVNRGDYILYGKTSECEFSDDCPEDFSVTYVSADDYFSVVLYELPLREKRLQAEAIIKEALEINDLELCELQYSVNVPYWVDETNSGMNLGFSSCAGSINL